MSQTERIALADWRADILKAKTEDAVDVEIEDVLKRHGIEYSKTRAERSYNEHGQIVRRIDRGWPDFTACLPDGGRMLLIESKRPVGGKLRYKQAETLKRFHAANALICIARSGDDLEQVIASGNRQRDIDEVNARLAQGLLASDRPKATRSKKWRVKARW